MMLKNDTFSRGKVLSQGFFGRKCKKFAVFGQNPVFCRFKTNNNFKFQSLLLVENLNSQKNSKF